MKLLPFILAATFLLTASSPGNDPVKLAGTAFGPAAGAQRNVDLAWSAGAQRTLAVWDDKRPSANGAEDIRGNFIGTAGDFSISAAAGDQKRPAAAGISTGFMVFWEDRRNTGILLGPRDIYAARVSATGAVTPTAGLQISAESDDESDVEAESGTPGVLAVWERSGLTPGLMMMRADPTGTLLDAAPLRLTSSFDQEPDIAASPGGFLVVWERYTGGKRIMAAKVTWTGGGAVETGPEFEVGPFVDEEAEPEVIWTGTSFLVTWAYRGADSLPATIVGRRVNADGTSPDAVPITLVNGVRAKDRALFNRAGCVQMVTMPELGEKVLRTQQVCYGAVIDIGSPVQFTAAGVDRPEDPSVAVDPVEGTVWVAWEDSRNNGTTADEDIYLRRYGSAATEPSVLLSSASEQPVMDGSPLLSGDWMAWRHRGGSTAEGLVVNSLASGRSLWFPAQLPWGTQTQGGNRPGTFAIFHGHDGSQMVLRLDRNRTPVGDKFFEINSCSPSGLGCGLYQAGMSFSGDIHSAESIAGVSAEVQPPLLTIRPALASVVGYIGPARECVLLAQHGSLYYAMAETRLGFPPPSGLPEATDYHGTKIAATGVFAAIAVWAGDSAGGGSAGRVWVRIIRSDSGMVTPASDWLDLGSLAWNHGPELAADAAGAVLFVARPAGDAGWRSVRIRWDGTVEAERPASSQVSPGLSVARHGSGFIGFQNLQGGVGGGEVRATEWDAALAPVQAWQWQNIILHGDLCLQSDNVNVRLSGNSGDQPGYGLWRPLRIQRIFWNAPVRGFWLDATGPAGVPVRVWQGDSLVRFTNYTDAEFEPPGPALYNVGGPGTMTFQRSNLAPAAGFFRLETPLLLRVNP